MASSVGGNSGSSDVESDIGPIQEVAGELVVGLVKAPSAALAVDLGRAREFRRHTKAEATEKAYSDAWARFRAWATPRGVASLPVPSEIVEAHVSWLAAEGYSLSTIGQFLTAGTHYHRAVGLDFPRSTSGVKETLKGIRRNVARAGMKRGKKAPLGLVALAEACNRLGQDAEGLRNRALLTVGWFCTLRSANLVAIQREHVRLVRFAAGEPIDEYERPEGLILHLPFSKTDQAGESRDVAVHAQPDESVCPVRALTAYFAVSNFAPSDLIFPISERTVSRFIKRLVANPAHAHKSLREIAACAPCAAAGARFASHSLRRGSATGLALAGVSERVIMRHGGWKNERVARGYMDDALLFENNPTKDLTSKEPAATTASHTERQQMGRSGHERALDEHFDKLLEEEPEWAKQMAIVRTKILGGVYPAWLVDAFFQKWEGTGKPTLAETYAFTQLYAQWTHGELCVFSAKVKSGPLSDASAKENQAILDELPDTFQATFIGGLGDNDGWFRWKNPLELTRVMAQPDGSEKHEPWRVEPDQLPLEVGYTKVSKTFEHVVGGRGVARWPYGHATIVVLITHPSLRERRSAQWDLEVQKHLGKTGVK